MNDHEQQLLELVRDEGLNCPRCGYTLGALDSCTCPECGRAFQISDWKMYGLPREIAAWVRLNSPVECRACHAIIGTACEGWCTFCRKRLNWADLRESAQITEEYTKLTPMVKWIVAGWIVLILQVVAMALMTFDRRHLSRPSPWWDLPWSVAISVCGGLLFLTVLVWLPRVNPMLFIIRAKPWYRRYVQTLTWSSVAVLGFGVLAVFFGW